MVANHTIVIEGFYSVMRLLTGGYHPLMGMMITMQIIDVITGAVRGIYFKELSSRKFNQGIIKKGVSWLIVIVAHIIDVILFDGHNSLLLVVLLAYIANDGLSIVENAAEMDILVPDIVKKHLKSVQNRAEIEQEKIVEKTQNNDKSV